MSEHWLKFSLNLFIKRSGGPQSKLFSAWQVQNITLHLIDLTIIRTTYPLHRKYPHQDHLSTMLSDSLNHPGHQTAIKISLLSMALANVRTSFSIFFNYFFMNTKHVTSPSSWTPNIPTLQSQNNEYQSLPAPYFLFHWYLSF